MSQAPQNRDYWCFISYRHSDNKQPGRQWATWLHQAIETYEVPADLVGTVNERGDTIPARIFPVFRDEEELPADADLASPIYTALDRSRFLVVLCSPRAALSPYVSNEIAYFKKIGRGGRILAAILDGEPNATDHPAKAGIAKECFPPALRYKVDGRGVLTTQRTEPIAPDFRLADGSEGWTTPGAYQQGLESQKNLTRHQITTLVEEYRQRQVLMLLKILAGIMGVPVGVLTKRDQAYQLAQAKKRQCALQRWLLLVGVLAVATLGAFGIAVWQREQTEQKRKEAVASKQETVASNQRNLKLLHEASMADYATALKRIEIDGRWHDGVAHLVRALKLEPSNRLAALRLYETILYHSDAHRDWPVTILNHHDGVSSASFSPDGTRILTSSQDKTARIWDVETGNQLGPPLRHSGNVNCAAFSPDGSRIVTASDDDSAQIWDAATGQRIGSKMDHEEDVLCAVFNPNGTQIVTSSKDKRITGSRDFSSLIWDAATGKPMGQFLPDGIVKCLSFSPDGSRIVTGSGYYYADVWDGVSRERAGERLPVEGIVDSVAFSPDGSSVVTAFYQPDPDLRKKGTSFVQIWDATKRSRIGEPIRHGAQFNSVAYSPDGRYFVTASEDATAQVWDATTGKSVGEPMRHNASVTSAAFSPDGSRIVTASQDKTAQIWSFAPVRPMGEPFPLRRISDAAFSPDGLKIVITSESSAQVWDLNSGRHSEAPMFSAKALKYASFSPDGSKIATVIDEEPSMTVAGDGGDLVRVWDTATGKSLLDPLHHDKDVTGAVFSADGSKILILQWGNGAWIWDASSGTRLGKPIPFHYHKASSPTSAVFNADGSKIVTRFLERQDVAQIWDAATGEPVGEPLREEGSINCAVFNPDGTRIVTTSDDKIGQVWDATSGKPVGERLHHKEGIQNASFSPDGLKIVTASYDKTARVWDVASSRPVGEPLRHEGQVLNASFSPDSARVVTASWDNSARVWDVLTSKPLGEPLLHESGVMAAAFSADGSRIISMSKDRARIWMSQKPGKLSTPSTVFLETIASAIAGFRFNEDGEMERIPASERMVCLSTPMNGEDSWSSLARWAVIPSPKQYAGPNNGLTCRQAAERERDFGSDQESDNERESSELALEESVNWDQTVPLSRLFLAKFEPNLQRAAFLRSYDLKRLPSDATLWTRASNALLEQGQLPLAIEAAQKAVSIDPNLPAAKDALTVALQRQKTQ